MSDILRASIEELCRAYGNDRSRMMDIVRAVQKKYGCVSSQAMDLIAARTTAKRVEVESVVSFYAFLSEQQKGKVSIRLCNDVIDKMAGVQEVAAVFEEMLGVRFGQTTPDGNITLDYAPCIGMCDQAPAALINDIVVTELSTDTARRIVAGSNAASTRRAWCASWAAATTPIRWYTRWSAIRSARAAPSSSPRSGAARRCTRRSA